jgi:hypothetical protein
MRRLSSSGKRERNEAAASLRGTYKKTVRTSECSMLAMNMAKGLVFGHKLC